MEREIYKKNIRDKEVFKEKSRKSKTSSAGYKTRYTQNELFLEKKAGEKSSADSRALKEQMPLTKEESPNLQTAGKYLKPGKEKKAATKAIEKLPEKERQKAHFKSVLEGRKREGKETEDNKKRTSLKRKIKEYKKESGKYKERIISSTAVATGKYAVAKSAVSGAGQNEKEDSKEDSTEQIFSVMSETQQMYVSTARPLYAKKAQKKRTQKQHVKSEPYKVQNERTVFKKYKSREAEHKSLSYFIEEMKQQFVKVVSRLKEIFASHKTVAVLIAAVILTIVVIIISIFSMGVGAANGIGIYLMGLSMSQDYDMTEADSYFTEKEMLLQEKIDNIAEEYPDYDEYVFDVDEIGHDPILLMAYLSSVYESYTLDEVKVILDEIFEKLYVLELEEAVEERTRDVLNEETGEYEEEIYYVKVLYVTLTRNDLDSVLVEMIPDEETKELYDIYTDTEGAHQSFINPFTVDWSQNISSAFGWRIHPISGQEKFHNGVDIALPTGTKIASCSKGKVIKSYYSDSAGNYVVVEDESGYRCHYMHLDERNVSAGDEVDYGDLIGTVGNTGNSTGPHLHLGIEDENRKWINPVFVVSTYVR